MGRKSKILPADSKLFQNQTEFRILERKIKRKGPLDFSLVESLEDATSSTVDLFGSVVKAYSFKGFEGLFLLKNAIPKDMQLPIIKKVLQEWTMPPNISNLDSHFHLPNKGIWNEYINWKKDDIFGVEEPMMKKRFFEGVQPLDLIELKTLGDKGVNSCEVKKERVISVYDPERDLTIDSPVDSMVRDNDQPISKIINRLRWVTLGYQYNWSKKEYHFDRVPAFPDSLSAMSQHIVDQTESLTGYLPEKWKAEAGIVNFYQPGDTLTAHQDKSEPNTSSPLLSLSMGLDCIFLFGTYDRSDKPIAIHLESGDIVIMSKKARRAFHGVPRVMQNTCPGHLLDESLISKHLEHTRVNINIRQVI